MSKFFNFNEVAKQAFDNDVQKFVSFNQLMMDVAHNSLDAGIDMKQANAKIAEKFRAMIGCNDQSSVKEIRNAIRRNQSLVYEIIEETVQNLLVTGWQKDPFFQQYVEMKNLALGDKNEFYVESDAQLSAMKVSGNHHSIIRQRLSGGSTFSLTTSWVAIKIYAEYERVATGVEEFGALVQKIYEAYDNYLRQTIYDTMVEYAGKMAAPFKKTGSVTAETLRELCETIEMLTGSKVVIMGTRAALRNVTALQNADYISNDMKNEHYKNGILGYWEGFELVELAQGFKKNDLTQHLVTNTMLWIMPVDSDKFIKVVNEGDSQMHQITTPETNVDFTYSAEMLTKLGVGVVFNKAYGVYDIAG